MAERRRDTPRQRARVVRNAQLTQDRRLIEIDALADDPLALEDEERRDATAEGAAGGWQRSQRAEMSAEQLELRDHARVGVVQRDQLVALVGKGGACLGEVAPYLLLAVVHVSRADQLVARMLERRDRRIEVVVVLGLHVLAHERLAALSLLGTELAEIELCHGQVSIAHAGEEPALIAAAATGGDP